MPPTFAGLQGTEEDMRIELLVDKQNNLGEGPVWDVAEQRLYWVDSLGTATYEPRSHHPKKPIW